MMNHGQLITFPVVQVGSSTAVRGVSGGTLVVTAEIRSQRSCLAPMTRRDHHICGSQTWGGGWFWAYLWDPQIASWEVEKGDTTIAMMWPLRYHYGYGSLSMILSLMWWQVIVTTELQLLYHQQLEMLHCLLIAIDSIWLHSAGLIASFRLAPEYLSMCAGVFISGHSHSQTRSPRRPRKLGRSEWNKWSKKRRQVDRGGQVSCGYPQWCKASVWTIADYRVNCWWW